MRKKEGDQWKTLERTISTQKLKQPQSGNVI